MTPTGLAPPPHDSGLHDSADAELAAEARSIVPPPSRRGLPQRFVGAPLWISIGAHALALLGLLLYARFGPAPTPIRPPGAETIQIVDLIDLQDFPTEALPVPETSPPEPPATEPVAEPQSPAAQPVQGPPQVITSEGGEVEVPSEVPDGETGGSVAERLRPGFSDPRLYADPETARLREPGLSDAERYRRHFQARVDALNDSLYGQTGPNTDWTVKDGSGDRWGISEEGIHLGPIKIPRALVPFPAASGTNADLEEAREQQRQREEIDRQEADRERRRVLEERNEAARQRREQSGNSGGDPEG